MAERFGVWNPLHGWWGELDGQIEIRGSRSRMRLYARDLNFLGLHIRPRGKPVTGFVCRPIPEGM